MSIYNSVVLTGELVTDLRKSHHVHDMDYYSARIRCDRGTGHKDELELIFNEHFLSQDLKKGSHVVIRGEFRSIDYTRNKSRHLGLYVYVLTVEPSDHHDYNKLVIEGTLCKNPITRVNPSGTEIAELMVEVKRKTVVSDHIPCIVWNDNERIGTLKKGDRVRIKGRIQSREHIKKTEKGSIRRLVYEVSVWEYAVITSENGNASVNQENAIEMAERKERQKESALRKHYQNRKEKERSRRITGPDEPIVIPMD